VDDAEEARQAIWNAIRADAKQNGSDIFELLVKAVREDRSYRDKVIPAWRVITQILLRGDTSRTEISIESKRAAVPIVLPVEQARPTPPADIIKLKQ